MINAIKQLANKALQLRSFIQQQYEHKDIADINTLFPLLNKLLPNSLTWSELADLLAQLTTYTLYVARNNGDKPIINLNDIQNRLPHKSLLFNELFALLEFNFAVNPELQKLFDEMIDTVNLLENNELKTNHELYFYEYFIKAYNAQLRRQKSVYFTPLAIADFMVATVDQVLKSPDYFNTDGLASNDQLAVFDFATGTGVFLYSCIQYILQNVYQQENQAIGLALKHHILKNFTGCEYQFLPAIIAQLTLAQLMKRFGYELQDDEQIKIGIVNTLDLTDKPISLYLPQNQSTENSKQDAILAIIGNPPYLYHSKNSTTIENENIGKKNIQQKNAIGELLETYMYIDGQRIKERNPKGLQDDYVKFFRFAQHLIDQTENGIVAIITNHSFLDNPTFRGMRKSLMNSFNHLYFVDLHGNSKRKETAIENITDENVFSISQGVAISIMIKQKGLDKRVFRTDLWGRRQDKILQLQNSSLNLMKWRVLLPTAPYYLFTKQNETPDNDYFSFWSLKNIFAKYSVGVITSNDAKFIDFKRDTLEKRMMQFDDKYDKHWIKPILYRPFDIRYIYYKPELLQRARQKIMTNMFFENQAIITSRIIKDPVFQHCILSNTITNSGLLATNTSSSSYIFPLYCSDIKIKYNHSNQSDGLSETPQQKSNFSKQFCEFINQRYPTLAINDLFNYIYAMLYSKLYRMKYADYLKIDFPHIPFCNSFEIVKQISELGKGLIAAQLHGQFPEGTYKDLCKFVGNLDGVIEKLVYTKDSDEKGKLYINGKQYFEQMPLCVYNYEIGSYQVIARYLKDRKNRPIEQIDIDTIERNVKIIAYTIDISDKIDKLAEAWI